MPGLLSELLKRLDVTPLPEVSPGKKSVNTYSLSDKPGHVQPTIGVRDPKHTWSGRYPKNVIQDILVAAKENHVDPEVALSIGLQESGLGTADNGMWAHNPTHLQNQTFNEKATPDESRQEDIIRRLDISGDARDAEERGLNLQVGLRYLRQQLQKHPRDLIRGIQGYNGYGKPSAEEYGDQLYGTSIDRLPKNVYGQRIVELMNRVVKPSPTLQEMIHARQ